MRGQAQRKRSTAITLVLAGSATLAGCGSPVEQRDAYASLNDCMKDWHNTAQCQPVRDGRYSSSYYYGPPYYGASLADGRPRPSPNAMDSIRVGTSGSSPSTSRSSFSSGSSPSSVSHTSGSTSSGTSRGGFGSTGHSSSSSSS